jgi:hypothetical protein
VNDVLEALEGSGFKQTGVDCAAGVTEWRYSDRSRATGIRLLERDGRFWGWIGPLDAAGRVRPLDRDTVDFYWDDLAEALGIPSPCGEAQLADAIRAQGASLLARSTESPSRPVGPGNKR